ncbi:unnamed protein product [Adineta steineri]|uniref:Uncharacterized protein n=1 Tax=Adineta steineri TaxID=433720 RepID=A0A819VW48_9BILA|nr:unnamed protein product [Adineta steineri]CAF4114730.1 unnamed protein product [Adineta steineri]
MKQQFQKRRPSDDGSRCGARSGERLGPRRRSCVEGFERSIEPGVAGGDDIFFGILNDEPSGAVGAGDLKMMVTASAAFL